MRLKSCGLRKRLPKKIARLEEPGALVKAQTVVILKSEHKLEDLLEAASLARSTYFYHQSRLTQQDKHGALKQAIHQIFIGSKRRYGYRRILLQLRSQGWTVNHKLVYKLMGQMNLKSKVRPRKKIQLLPGAGQLYR